MAACRQFRPGLSVWISSILSVAVLLAGCQKQAGAPSAGVEVDTPPATDLCCTSWPLLSIASTLAGSDLQTRLLAPPDGFSPVNRLTWFPDDDLLGCLADARLIVDSGPGAPYAGWVAMTSLAEDRLCNATRNFRLNEFLPIEDWKTTHSHGPEGEHSHDYLVPYCWLQPELAIRMVREVSGRMKEAWPDLAGAIDGRTAGLIERLEKVQAGWRSIPGLEQAPVLLASPDLLFLARGLGRELPYRLWNDAPGAETWKARLDELAGEPGWEQGGLVLFPGEVPASLAALQENRWQFIAVDLLDRPSGDSDLADRLQAVGADIEAAIKSR